MRFTRIPVSLHLATAVLLASIAAAAETVVLDMDTVRHKPMDITTPEGQKTKAGTVTLVNPAIGGTTLSQNLVLMPRWLKDTPEPDLVTVWFGYNDWSSAVRGDRFAEYLGMAVDRIRRLTGGHADVLLMTTCPAYTRWDTMAEMADAVRRVARHRQTGLADVAAAFHAADTAEEAKAQGLWVRDNTHLGMKGHQVRSDAVMEALREQER